MGAFILSWFLFSAVIILNLFAAVIVANFDVKETIDRCGATACVWSNLKSSPNGTSRRRVR